MFDNRFVKNMLIGNDCLKWKQAKDDSIWERKYYKNKYIEDGKFIDMMRETSDMLTKVKSEKNTQKKH